jgi:hypothetical protein
MSIDFSAEFSATALRQERISVLRFATRLTKDATDRLQALERADINSGLGTNRKPDNDPGRLICEAEAYYTFIKGA